MTHNVFSGTLNPTQSIIGPPESTSLSVQLFLQGSRWWHTDTAHYSVCKNRPHLLRRGLIIQLTKLTILSLWHSHCQSSLSSFDEYKLSATWPPTLTAGQVVLCAQSTFLSWSPAVMYSRSETVPWRADSNCWCNQHSWCDTKHHSHHTEPDTQHIAHQRHNCQ